MFLLLIFFFQRYYYTFRQDFYTNCKMLQHKVGIYFFNLYIFILKMHIIQKYK